MWPFSRRKSSRIEPHALPADARKAIEDSTQAVRESLRQKEEAMQKFDDLRARCEQNGFAAQWLATIEGGAEEVPSR